MRLTRRSYCSSGASATSSATLRTGRAGLPTATWCAGMDLVTTDEAPTTQPSPTVTPGLHSVSQLLRTPRRSQIKHVQDHSVAPNDTVLANSDWRSPARAVHPMSVPPIRLMLDALDINVRAKPCALADRDRSIPESDSWRCQRWFEYMPPSHQDTYGES